ncbi:MAG: LysM peptidoglycan-binding domain-containing protein [Caldilineaceae bacterium]
MDRRQLVFLILVNAIVSLAIALVVVWAVEARRPDPEELAALYTPVAQGQPLAVATTQPAVVAVVNQAPTAAAQDAPTAAAPTVSAASGEQQIYVVQAGDSLGAIAQRFHVTMDAIMAANQIKDPNFVFSGQQLKIPGKGDAANPPATPTASTAASDTTTVNSTPVVTPTVASTPTTPAGLQIETVDGAGNLPSEAVLIVNNSDVAYNLQGWRLERQDGPAYTFGAVQLFQGSSVWVHSTEGADTTIALYWKQSNPVWQSGAVARLVNPQGEVVASFKVP